METYPVARSTPLRNDARVVKRLYALTKREGGEPTATVILCNESGRPCRVVRLHTECELNRLRLELARLKFVESDLHHITDEHGHVLDVWVPDPEGRFRGARLKREAAAFAEEYEEFDAFEDPDAAGETISPKRPDRREPSV